MVRRTKMDVKKSPPGAAATALYPGLEEPGQRELDAEPRSELHEFGPPRRT